MMSCAITFLGMPVKRTLQSVEEPPAKEDTAEDYQYVFLFVCFTIIFSVKLLYMPPLFLCRNYIKELAICIQSNQPTPETLNVIKNLGECMGRVTSQVIFKRCFVSTSVERELEGMLWVSLIFNKVFVSSMC